jgi:hypothetical protein
MVYADDDSLRTLRRYYEVCAGNLEHDYELTRRDAPAEWDVISQLFWRDSSSALTEQSSVRLAHIVPATGSEARLVLPPSDKPYAEFRIDLTIVFALLELRVIRVLDRHDNELCRWSMPGDLTALQAGGLHSILTEDGAGALVLNSPIGSQIRLPVAEPVRERLQEGGTFVIEMKALDGKSFTQRMAAAYGSSEARHREVTEGLVKALRSAEQTATERTAQMKEIERSFLYRLARRFR